MRVGVAPVSLARPLGLLALGAVRPELVTSLRAATMHWAWTLPSGLTWLFVAGCAVAAWLIGYGTGYRRGVNDAITGGIRKPDQRLNEE
jgi:hypothetical protein